MPQFTCSECKEPCNLVVEDFGIGPYEFWGQKCVDTDMAVVSDCCEAEVLDDNGNFYSYYNYKQDQEDARADYELDRWKERKLGFE